MPLAVPFPVFLYSTKLQQFPDYQCSSSKSHGDQQNCNKYPSTNTLLHRLSHDGYSEMPPQVISRRPSNLLSSDSKRAFHNIC